MDRERFRRERKDLPLKLIRLRSKLVILLTTLGLFLCIDQILLLNSREAKFSFWNSLIWHQQRPSLFVPHSEVGFLLDPSKKHLLGELTMSKAIPFHADYNLDTLGFRRNSTDTEKRFGSIYLATPLPSAYSSVKTNTSLLC